MNKIIKKLQIGFIRQSLKAMSKEHILGIVSIIAEYPDSDTDAQEILSFIRHEWDKRRYDLTELDSFMLSCRNLHNDEVK